MARYQQLERIKGHMGAYPLFKRLSPESQVFLKVGLSYFPR